MLLFGVALLGVALLEVGGVLDLDCVACGLFSSIFLRRSAGGLSITWRRSVTLTGLGLTMLT